MEKIQIDEETCRKNLASLSYVKSKVLTVTKMGAKETPSQSEEGDVKMIDTENAGEKEKVKSTPQDLVRLNPNFSSNLMRINLPIPTHEEMIKKQVVTVDRTHAVEAQIVKIMKTRKKLAFTELMQEVMAGLKMFQPEPKFIKATIERLIEREFMARDEADKTLLLYLA